MHRQTAADALRARFVATTGQPMLCGRRQFLSGLMATAASLAGGRWLEAAPVEKATNASQAREEAIRTIPYRKLTTDGRTKVDAVLANVSLYRRLPLQVVRCDPQLYLFMVNNPDVTVNLWQVLGVSQVELKRTSTDTYHAKDTVGTKGDIQFLHRSFDLHLIYCVGTYEGPLFEKPVRGGCLLLLKTGYVRETDGYHYVTNQLDLFFSIEHAGVDFLAKTFQPLVGKAADYNFTESTNFLGTLSNAAETRPEAMQKLAGRLDKVQAEQRDELELIVAAVAQKAEERRLAAATKGTVPREARRTPTVGGTRN